MNEEIFKQRTKNLALRVIRLVESLPDTENNANHLVISPKCQSCHPARIILNHRSDFQKKKDSYRMTTVVSDIDFYFDSNQSLMSRKVLGRLNSYE